MNVVLLGLTGMANPVLESLHALPDVRVTAVFTERYENAYPFYPEVQLDALCAQLGIPCHADIRVSRDDGFALLEAAVPDAVIVATFRQILKRRVIELPKLGTVNLHPSLLPRHRGPCPIQAAILAGDARTGVTAHWMTEAVDRGDVLLQQAIEIGPQETDGGLRRRLAAEAGRIVPDLVRALGAPGGPASAPQDETAATQAPKPDPGLAALETSPDLATLLRRMRAFMPFPGATWSGRGMTLRVQEFELFDAGGMDEVKLLRGGVEIVEAGRGVRLKGSLIGSPPV